MDFQLVRIKTALKLTGDSCTTFHEKIRDELYPKPVKLGKRSSAWPLAELETVVKARIAGKTEGQIRAIVRQIHYDRKRLV